MQQIDSFIGQEVLITPANRLLYIRENHNPKGAGVGSKKTDPERSWFVLWENITPVNPIVNPAIKMAMKIVSKEVREPWVVRKGIVKRSKK